MLCLSFRQAQESRGEVFVLPDTLLLLFASTIWQCYTKPKVGIRTPNHLVLRHSNIADKADLSISP